MPKPSEEPLTKVTLNLFRSDVIAFKRRYGHGYTEQIRNLVRANVMLYKKFEHDMDRLGTTFLTEDMVDGED